MPSIVTGSSASPRGSRDTGILDIDLVSTGDPRNYGNPRRSGRYSVSSGGSRSPRTPVRPDMDTVSNGIHRSPGAPERPSWDPVTGNRRNYRNSGGPGMDPLRTVSTGGLQSPRRPDRNP